MLRAVSDVGIAELLESERTKGQVVAVAGLVTSLQRKVTKEKGEPWAIMTLGDLDAEIDVMVFPRTYATVWARLVEDAVVVVKGRFDRREEETPRLTAMEITLPDLTAAQDRPVRVSMDIARCVKPVLDQFKDVLSSHPGPAEVQLLLRNGERTTVLRLDERLRVSPSPALSADLKALLGADCLA